MGNICWSQRDFCKTAQNPNFTTKITHKKVDLQLFACASHNIWPRIKNPGCFENLQVISTRLYQLIWILLFYGAILKTNKIKTDIWEKHYKNCYFSNINSVQNLVYLWLYESHRSVIRRSNRIFVANSVVNSLKIKFY